MLIPGRASADGELSSCSAAASATTTDLQDLTHFRRHNAVNGVRKPDLVLSIPCWLWRVARLTIFANRPSVARDDALRDQNGVCRYQTSILRGDVTPELPGVLNISGLCLVPDNRLAICKNGAIRWQSEMEIHYLLLTRMGLNSRRYRAAWPSIIMLQQDSCGIDQLPGVALAVRSVKLIMVSNHMQSDDGFFKLRCGQRQASLINVVLLRGVLTYRFVSKEIFFAGDDRPAGHRALSVAGHGADDRIGIKSYSCGQRMSAF